MLADVIIPAVKEILLTVGGVGANVHPYVRVTADDAGFNALFLDKNAGTIHGYTITRESTSVVEADVSAARDMHTIAVRGYRAVQDANATETAMQTEIELVRTAFFAKRHLEAVDGTRRVFWCDRMSVRTFAYAMFAGVLCHYVELVLMVHDYPIS